ncbi:hypothetical protein Daesc_009743 [Daldinia eschscholtzii]|uniref:Uncharacterized protein n=1 Tax=Daldinia eschscholtzii TaxID=292717 RepID=A0AAX6MAI4_9PEZI
MEMVQNSHQPPNSETPSPSLNDNSPQPQNGNVLDVMGKLSLTDNHAVYTGSSHWVTILDDIRHLKDELSEEYPEEYPESSTNIESTLFDTGLIQGLPATRSSLLNSAPRFSREQIIAMMPPRRVADRH